MPGAAGPGGLAMKLMPQLAFNGNCRQAFEHYEKLLRGKITLMNAPGRDPGRSAAAGLQTFGA